VLELETKMSGGRPVEPLVTLLYEFDSSAYPAPPSEEELPALARVNGSAEAARNYPLVRQWDPAYGVCVSVPPMASLTKGGLVTD